MSELHGPKCQEMRFPAFQFSKIFRGSMPPDPPTNDGLKPIVWVLRTHNRLLFTKLRLLKNLYTTLRCTFFNKECNDWDEYIDSLGDGTRISFPVRAKPFLTWGPKTHKLVNGKIVSKPRYHLEKVSLNFNKMPVTIV